MPTLAGWYLSPESCRAWLKLRDPSRYERNPRAGTGALSWAIEQDLKAKGLGKHIDLRFISPPKFKGTEDERPGWGLMIVRRSSADKVYISCEASPVGFDIIGRKILNQNYGLELPEWSVVWWEMKDGRMVSEFLHPAI
ncbi:hypothetical protein FRC07_007851 [Ceratobasidium sp. 392]|nr:hypothetical protein FRC07_007851 [Ceratobasidium sp. 392]